MRSNGREDIKNAHILALNMPHMNFSYKGNFSLVCAKSHDLMDYGLPGTSVHGIFEARILKGVAISFSRGSRMEPESLASPALAGRFFTPVPPGKPNN